MVNADSTDMVCAFIGGVLIALASTLNLLLLGRITGLSGIFNSLATLNTKAGMHWKISFLTGMIAISYPTYRLTDEGVWRVNSSTTIVLFDPEPIAVSNLHWIGWILGGLLVGIGTRMGNGCTSGHGVCGLPRFSIRSLAAVCTFMTTGIAIATLFYHANILQNG